MRSLSWLERHGISPEQSLGKPTAGIGPFAYEIYLDGSEVEEVRGDLQLDSEYFFDCNARPRPTPAEFTITAKSHGFISPHSEPITLCF